jgi:hypothetical protein
MWLHDRVPSLGVGRIPKHNCTLLDLDDTGVQIYAQQFPHEHTHNEATSGSSTIISGYFLGGEG